jgi:type I restriction enzyme S subunit
MSILSEVPLRDVVKFECEIVTASDIENGTLYVGLENIESGGTFVNVRQVDNGELASSKFAFNENHLLYGKLRPYLAKIARPYFNGVCSTDILPILASEGLDRGYLAYFLQQNKMIDKVNSQATGANLPRVNARILGNLSIPLPSLPEQRRIAEVLDQAEALRAKRCAALAQLDTLTQAIFLEMFGDPVINPKGWEVVRLGDHVKKIGSGATPTGGESAYKASGISLIRSMNVRDGVFKYKDLAFIDEIQAAKLSNVQVEEDDVLLNITGASVARVCRAPKAVLPACVNQHVSIIRPKSNLNKIFLEQLLLTSRMKRKLLKIGGSGATREAITKAQIEELDVICPPCFTQNKFAHRVSAVESMKAVHFASLVELDTLFTSLQHRAFRGEL